MAASPWLRSASVCYRVVLDQLINTPGAPFLLSYDYLFQTTTGVLTVILNSIVIDELDAATLFQTDFVTRDLFLDAGAFTGLTGTALQFSFDGPTGSRVFLDNVSISAVPASPTSGLFWVSVLLLGALRGRRTIPRNQ